MLLNNTLQDYQNNYIKIIWIIGNKNEKMFTKEKNILMRFFVIAKIFHRICTIKNMKKDPKIKR